MLPLLKNQTEIYLLSSSPEFDGRKQLSQPEHIYLSSTFCVIQHTTRLGAGLKGLSHKHVKSCLDQRWMTISTAVEKWLIISIRSTSATCEWNRAGIWSSNPRCRAQHFLFRSVRSISRCIFLPAEDLFQIPFAQGKEISHFLTLKDSEIFTHTALLLWWQPWIHQSRYKRSVNKKTCLHFAWQQSMHIHRCLLSLLDPCNKHSNMKTPLKAYEKERIFYFSFCRI